MYGFSRVKNRRVIGVKNLFFLGVTLAILLLPPSLKTFFHFL